MTDTNTAANAVPTPGSMRPVVSLAMPVYNGARFLAESLDSLLAQGFSDFELIISDNASTDDSERICRDYAARDPRIRYVRQPRNIGAVANWNYLVHVARGRYFKWSSSNDVCAPQLLERCVSVLDQHADTVLCYGATALMEDDGKVIEIYGHDLEILDRRPSVRFRRARLEMRLNNAQSALMRLDVLRKTALERAYPEGDMPLMAELALLGGFRRLPEVLLYRRMGKDSATRYMTPEQKAAFRNPATAADREYVVWPMAWDYLKTLARTPIPLREKLVAVPAVLRQFLWSRGEAREELQHWFRNRATVRGTKRQPTIALLGAYSSKNFGDTAIQASAIHHLRRLQPGVNLIGISHDALDTLQTHGIEGWTLQATPGIPDNPRLELDLGLPAMLWRRWSQWRRMLRIAGTVDVLVISGSGQLEDYWGGPWGHAYTLLAWAAAFRLRGKRVAVLATGLDDLSTRLGRTFILRMLGLAQYRSFRDAGTLTELRKLGFGGQGKVCPDLAFSYPISRPVRTVGDHPVVVVCPISHRAFRRQAPGIHEAYLRALSEACLAFAAAGYRVLLSNSQVDLDGPLLREFHKALVVPADSPGSITLSEAKCVADYLEIASNADLVVASRLHALILSTVCATPSIAISYSRKVTQMMSDIGAASFCVQLNGVAASDVVRMARESLAQSHLLKAALEGYVSAMATALDAEYREVVQLLPPATQNNGSMRSTVA